MFKDRRAENRHNNREAMDREESRDRYPEASYSEYRTTRDYPSASSERTPRDFYDPRIRRGYSSAGDEHTPRFSGNYSTGQESYSSGAYSGKPPKNYRRSDERIREDICDRLTQISDINKEDIEVKVKDCEVTLTGSVETRSEKRRVEDICDEVTGVTDVQNNLKVSGRQGSQSIRSESQPNRSLSSV